jgi:DNA-binding CsgD family transcriptional regulator
LEVLAVGAPMRLEVFEALASTDSLEELERAQLAAVSEETQGLLVEVAHPLYGEVVLGDLPASVARRIRRDLAGALARLSGETPAERLAVARLMLESGQADDQRFLEASSIALELGAPDLAGELAAALPPSLTAALRLANARAGAGRFADAERVLAPFEAEAASAEVELATAYVETRLRCLLSAGEQPEQVRRIASRFETWHDDADWRALTATVFAWIAMHHNAYVEAASLVAAPLADPAVGAERRMQLLFASARSTARRGRVDDYDAIMGEVGRIMSALGGRELGTTMHGLRVDAARVAAARDLLGMRQRIELRLEHPDQGDDPFEYFQLLYALAHIEHMQGHHGEARILLQRAIDHLVGADRLNLGPITEVMLSITLSYLGEENLARQALDRSEAAIGRMPSLARKLAPDLDRARAMLEMAAGRESAAREQLLVAAATAGDDVLVATESLHVALLLGADAEKCASGLESLALEAQDDAIQAWARHARAVADKNPAAQLAAAEVFEELGLDLDAAQAAAMAAVTFRHEGLGASANRAGALAARCADRCPGVRLPALAARSDAPDLTAREREIAGLAARGLSNKDIADALVLSVRTVEAYVLRACRKLGVQNRTELARTLGVRDT